jgi:hypothetical protein
MLAFQMSARRAGRQRLAFIEPHPNWTRKDYESKPGRVTSLAEEVSTFAQHKKWAQSATNKDRFAVLHASVSEDLI